MTSPELPVLMNLYSQIAPGELFRLLQRNLGIRTRTGIYTPRVVIWMMMSQRLEAQGTLAQAVEPLAPGQFDPLLSRCKRVREDRIAVSTGGYCQARQNLPKVMMERSVEEILQRLRNHLSERLCGLDRPVYVLDGSSLRLDHGSELKRAYPPGHTGQGAAHGPILRLVVLQDLETGLAQQPCWGPMYGPKAVSEPALAERALEPLPPGAVMVGDRNFGIFSVAYSARQKGHGGVIRLTAQRAQRLMGAPLSREGDYEVTWRPSRWDPPTADQGPADTAIPGRLIARRMGRGRSKQWLYRFTEQSIPADQIVSLYGKRWNVETDLRSLKQTMRLQHLSVQSVDMMEKELLASVLAYNLVRAIMCLAARKVGIHTRQLSFTYAYNIVQDGISSVLAAPTVAAQIERMGRIVDLVARCRLPNRIKPRSFPRAVWGRGQTYPARRGKTK